MAEFDESAVTRDERGRFSSGGGGGSVGGWAQSKAGGAGRAGGGKLSTWARMRAGVPSPEQALSGIRGMPQKASATRKEGGGTEKATVERTWVDSRPDLPKETWHDHYDAHPDHGGKVSPQRRTEVHEPILHAALSKVPSVPAGQPKIAIVTMGAPASGKSSGLRRVDTSQFVHVDPDGIKEQLPEYRRATEPGRSFRGAAAMAHEESSHLAKQVMKGAIEQNKHVIVDATGTNAQSMISKIQELKAAGYHVHLAMSHLDQKSGLERAAARAEQTGRSVPERVIRAGYTQVPRNFEKIAAHADTFQMSDSRRPGSPIVWTRGADGKETHHEPAFVEHFRAEYR